MGAYNMLRIIVIIVFLGRSKQARNRSRNIQIMKEGILKFERDMSIENFQG